MTLGVVLGFKQLLRLIPGNLSQASSFAGTVVHAVADLTTASSADKSETVFHAIVGSIAMFGQPRTPPLASSRRVGAGSQKVVEEPDFWCPFWCPFPSGNLVFP